MTAVAASRASTDVQDCPLAFDNLTVFILANAKHDGLP